MAVKIGSARIDENGNAHGGAAGDQTGKELSTQSWYKHAKGWRVFRAKSAAAAEKIAQDMEWACANKHIGYDQYQRTTLYNTSKPLGFNCKEVATNCETDCSALVRVCCAYAGIDLPNFRTTDEPKVLLNSGEFKEMTGAKYTDSSTYLKRGDILCTKVQGHTVVVLSNGSKAASDVATVEGLSKGDKGDDVRQMQLSLLLWNADCLPKYGADGDFGSETEKALKSFQDASNLPVTGICDSATENALMAIGGPKYIITTGAVNVRSAPGTDNRVLGVAGKGARLEYQGETIRHDGRDWFLILYKNQNGWISSKYSYIE